MFGVTGASGAPYAVRLLEVLAHHGVPVWLIVSKHGWRLLEQECRIANVESLRAATGNDWSSITLLPDDDRGAAPASGSRPTAGMVVCPCSMGTVAAIAQGTSRSLIERAADHVNCHQGCKGNADKEYSLDHLRLLALEFPKRARYRPPNRSQSGISAL